MHILILDDDPLYNQLLNDLLQRNGYEVTTTIDPQKALQLLKENTYQLAIVDYKLPGTDGLKIIAHLKSHFPSLPVILSTNYNDVRVAVASIKLGAFEFISKPIVPDELLKVVSIALSESSKPESGTNKDSPPSQPTTFVMGSTKSTETLWQHINLVAPTKLNVLIQGESGTGKEHVAQTIHAKSIRKTKPFIAIDCGALSVDLALSELFGHVKGAFTGALSDKVGLFEEANGGTLFLDELGNLPYDIQTALLRVLQEGKLKRVGGTSFIPVDVRIIAATNASLLSAENDATFRLDLYHRINEFEVHIPPLRDRKEDLPLFCDHFLHLACREFGKPTKAFSDEVLNIFTHYSWPGNLRELKNIIRRIVLLSDTATIGVEVLPTGLKELSLNTSSMSQSTSLKDQHEVLERTMIMDTLIEHKYNKAKTARALGIDRTTLYNKMKRYGIS